MRNMFFALLAAGMIAGCGDNNKDDKDAGSSSPDLKSPTTAPDLANPSTKTLTCVDIYNCYYDCASSSDDVATCFQDECAGNAKKTAYTQDFINAISCVQDWCTGANDMGPGTCIVVDNYFKDADGSDPTATSPCGLCLTAASSRLDGVACPTDASQADCDPAPCKAYQDRCINTDI